MENELDKLLGEEGNPSAPAESDPPKGVKVEKKEEEKKAEEELRKKEEKLSNLNRAITEAEAELLRVRKEKQKTKAGIDDELPKIDLEDPSARAWDKHIGGLVEPLHAELEESRAEVRSIALREFLNEHPSLAKNPEKVKELMQVYDRLRTTKETVTEGVKGDLKKAFGAVYGEELIKLAQKKRIDEAKAEEVLSDVAISRGATSYSDDTPSKKKTLTAEERSFLKIKWGMTDEQIEKMYG